MFNIKSAAGNMIASHFPTRDAAVRRAVTVSADYNNSVINVVDGDQVVASFLNGIGYSDPAKPLASEPITIMTDDGPVTIAPVKEQPWSICLICHVHNGDHADDCLAH